MIALMDLTNRRFGQLVAIRRVENRGRFVRWLCRCDCGNEKIIQSRHLTSGGTRHCRIRGFHSKIGNGEAAFNQFYRSTFRNAINRKYEWELSREQVKDISVKNCFYCGKPPSQIIKGGVKNKFVGDCVYNGIDRVDNKKGYVIDNCVPCCGRCNRAKDVFSLGDFRNFVVSIYNHWAKT